MNELIAAIANQTGFDSETTQKGLGALLATVKEHAPEDAFTKIASAIPSAGELLSQFQANQNSEENEESDLSLIAGLASGLFGGKSSEQISTLVSMFSKGGFSLNMIKEFLPAVVNYFQQNGKSDVVEAIAQAIPGISEYIGGGESTAAGVFGQIKKLF